MPARLDIAMQRNEDFACTLEITDSAGDAIDLTGWALVLTVKERLEADEPLQTGEIEIIDAPTGLIGIGIQGPGAVLGSYGDPLLSYELPFDLIATDPEGTPTALLAGYVIISRGIT